MQRVSFREKFPQPGRRSDAHQCSQHFCFLDRRALVHQILFTRRLKDRDKGLTLFMPKEEKVPSDTGGFKSAEGKKKRWSVSWTLVPWNNPLLNTFIYEFTPENTFLLLWYCVFAEQRGNKNVIILSVYVRYRKSSSALRHMVLLRTFNRNHDVSLTRTKVLFC